MQTKAKSNSVITSTFDSDTRVLTFNVLGQGSLRLDLNRVSAANLARAAVHGFNQRIPDSAAIGQADSDGVPIAADERTRMKFERMRVLCEHYETGTEDWARRAAGGEGGARSITLEALARVQACTYEEAQALVARRAEKSGKKPAAILAVLRNASAIAAAILKIREERTASAGSAEAAEDMLAELNEDGGEDAAE